MTKKILFSLCLLSSFHLAWAKPSSPSGFAPQSTYSISPGLSVFGSFFGPSLNSYVGFRPMPAHELYLGADLGLDLFFPNGFLMNISLLPAAWYQIRFPHNDNFRLVVGLAFGPTILVGGSGTLSGGVTYEFLFRPGFLFRTAENMLVGADLKFGVVSSVFVFKPQFNMIFTL